MIGWLDTIIKALDKVVKAASFTLGLLGAITDPKKWGMSGTELAASIQTKSTVTPSGVGAGGGYVGSVFVPPTIKTPSVVVPSTGGTVVPSMVGSSAAAASSAASSVSQNIGVSGVSGYAMALNRNSNDALLAAGQFQRATSITVNMGVVGDPESAARTIVDVVNNGYYRGTGGASNFVGATAS